MGKPIYFIDSYMRDDHISGSVFDSKDWQVMKNGHGQFWLKLAQMLKKTLHKVLEGTVLVLIKKKKKFQAKKRTQTPDYKVEL